jgi:hypothetical protein
MRGGAEVLLSIINQYLELGGEREPGIEASSRPFESHELVP